MYCEICNKKACTILDLNCNRCGKRLCRQCGISLKCYKCRVLVCECYKINCQYSCDKSCNNLWCFNHKCDDDILWKFDKLDDDEYIINKLYDEYCNHPYIYKYNNVNDIVRFGKLTKEIAQCIVNQLNGSCDSSDEKKHTDADETLYWFIDSIKFYKTLDEAKQVGNVLKTIDVSQF